MSDEIDNPLKSLTDKQRTWYEAYVGVARYNATEAARIAGYAFPNVEGAKVRETLSDLISAHFDAAAMTKNEVARRLADIARGVPEDFLVETTYPLGDSEDGEVAAGWAVDVAALKKARLGHLVKGIKTTANGQNIELHDSLAALDKLARFHSMYVDRTEVSGANGGPIKVESDLPADLRARLEAIANATVNEQAPE